MLAAGTGCKLCDFLGIFVLTLKIHSLVDDMKNDLVKCFMQHV